MTIFPCEEDLPGKSAQYQHGSIMCPWCKVDFVSDKIFMVLETEPICCPHCLGLLTIQHDCGEDGYCTEWAEKAQ